jgi:hypothetical protein
MHRTTTHDLHMTPAIVLGDDQGLHREQRAEAEAERQRRVEVYTAWVERHGRLGDDLPGILAGTAEPPPAPHARDRALQACNRREVPPADPCTHCKRRPRSRARTDGLCYNCRYHLARRPPCSGS